MTTEVILTGTGVPHPRPAQDLRDGGYRGTITVGEDLTTVILG